jgi:hypothetical protein
MKLTSSPSTGSAIFASLSSISRDLEASWNNFGRGNSCLVSTRPDRCAARLGLNLDRIVVSTNKETERENTTHDTRHAIHPFTNLCPTTQHRVDILSVLLFTTVHLAHPSLEIDPCLHHFSIQLGLGCNPFSFCLLSHSQLSDQLS